MLFFSCNQSEHDWLHWLAKKDSLRIETRYRDLTSGATLIILTVNQLSWSEFLAICSAGAVKITNLLLIFQDFGGERWFSCLNKNNSNIQHGHIQLIQ